MVKPEKQVVEERFPRHDVAIFMQSQAPTPGRIHDAIGPP
jgi:hypothetical protein